jgi:hypothetical protein
MPDVPVLPLEVSSSTWFPIGKVSGRKETLNPEP